MTQAELAERWRISEATLERWRTESKGPMFLKLGNQVRYRVQYVEAFEEVALRGSTKTDGGVEQPATAPRPAFGLPRMSLSPLDRSRSGCAQALVTHVCARWSPRELCRVNDRLHRHPLG